MFVFTENCKLVNLDNAAYVGVASSTSNTPCIRAYFGENKKHVDIITKCKNMTDAKDRMRDLARAISNGQSVYTIAGSDLPDARD